MSQQQTVTDDNTQVNQATTAPRTQRSWTRRELVQGAAAIAGSAALFAASGGVGGMAQRAQAAGAAQTTRTSGAKPNILFVHGAWADGSSWSQVISILRERGYPALAVQLALNSLADDVAHTQQVLKDRLAGPTVLVGHSYGGAVISGAAYGQANVISLVYASAFAPNAGEVLGALINNYPPTPLASHLQPDSAGKLWIDPAAFHDVFCQDISADDAALLAITQNPLAASIFGEVAGPAAWQTLPSWYFVSQDDRAISPDLERFFAARMKATTVELPSSHASLISHPETIADLIVAASKR